MRITGISIRGVTKRFGDLVAVNNVSLEIEKGEFFTLLGPSGCGKTTLLRCVAGFVDIQQGQIFFGDRRMDTIPTHRRGVGMVFQNYAVFPHLSVQDNVKYGLKAHNVPAAEQVKRVKKVLSMVHMEGLEERLPNQLSGGQLQRVAIARVLAIEPEVLLMDEPLSNLDAKLRVETRGEIRALQQSLGITTIYVTHDQEEALSISDRIAVMNQGVVCQVARPWEIYSAPKDAFVAGFIGAANLIPVEVAGAREGVLIGSCGQVSLALPPQDGLEPGEQIKMALRPELIQILYQGETIPPTHWILAGRVTRVEYLGNMIKYEVSVADRVKLMVLSYHTDPSQLRKLGEEVRIHYPINRAMLFQEDQKA